MSSWLWLLLFAFAVPEVAAQTPGETAQRPPNAAASPQAGTAESSVPPVGYLIGADDQLTVTVLQAPELNTTARVSQEGLISLPLLGPVRAAGLSPVEFERALREQLGAKYMKNPEVTVQVTDIRSQGLSVVGAVAHPGVLQVRGSTRLLDVLSLAGGLTPDAGHSVLIVHHGAAAPIEIPLKPLMESRDLRLNVPVFPGDVVNVRPADIVYVVGAVKKPGAFAMQGNDRLTVLRALALSEGLVPTAQKNAIVVRTSPSGERAEIAVDLGRLLKGQNPDVGLQAHDVLFVPTSGSKVAARATLDALVRVLSFRPY